MVVLVAIIIILIFLLLLYFLYKHEYPDSDYMNFIKKRASIYHPNITYLDNKINSYSEAKLAGIKTPKILLLTRNPKDLYKIKPPFVCKPNHWSGKDIFNNYESVRIIKNKKDVDICVPIMEKLIRKRYTKDKSSEKINPRFIIAEELIPNPDVMKIYFFNGNPKLLQYVCDKETLWIKPDYTPLNIKLMRRKQKHNKLPYLNKPKYWDEVINKSKILTKLCPETKEFVRIDFLVIPQTDKYYFNEMTFHPSIGFLYRFSYTKKGRKLFDQLMSKHNVLS